jgi:plastocyanin
MIGEESMERKRLLWLLALCLVSSLLLAGVNRVQASTRQRQARPPATSAQANPPVRSWHVIAGYSQMLPAMNGSTEAVNQFYPRDLTIYAGDRVTWTINSTNEVHTVTFGPDSILRPLEDPQKQAVMKMLNGKQVFLANPAVFFPSSAGPLVERDSGSAKTLLNCGAFAPANAPGPHSCTVTFPNVGTFAYDCLLHSGIPGNEDMDGVIRVIARPQAVNHTWTVWAGTGKATDALDGFFPDHLTIHVGDRVTWKSGGVFFHTVSFGIDPAKTPLLVPVAKGPHGPILAFNPSIINPIIPKDGVYTGGVASSGVFALTGNYVNLPGQTFLKAPFTLTFAKPGVYTYYCLVHSPSMTGTITVLPAGQ